MSQISSNLLKKAFATWQHTFLSTSIVFYDIFARACTEIKILKVTYVFRLFDFLNFFFTFPFSPFLFFSLHWLTFYWACFHFKQFSESMIETGNFYRGVAMCSHRKFCSEFFTQLFEHFSCIFQAPLSQSLWSGYHWKDLFLLQKLSIDDANFGQWWWHQKWNKGQGSSRPVTGSTGVNGLSSFTKNKLFNMANLFFKYISLLLKI